MPQGFKDLEEAQLDKAPRLINATLGRQLRVWWLAADRPEATTPIFDIASTCTIDGKAGLLLVEAKAHDQELIKETAGRELTQDASEERKATHKPIGSAILSARDGLHEATSLEWHLSRDSHYQMSNRFAWSWKLAEVGVPVVLIYLGFLNAEEMANRGKPFRDHAEWERAVKVHSEPLFPSEVWNQRWMCNGQPFVPLIRSVEQRLSNEVRS